MQKPIKISRSGLKLFLECPRCFWLDLHHKIKRPPSYPYTLAAAVDFLVKQEFDKYRDKGTLPPVFKKYFDANPVQSYSADRHPPVGGRGRALNGVKLYQGEDLSVWRNNFKGISCFDEDLQAMLYGAVDDVLEFKNGALGVIDYKSTGSREVTIYDDYQKQMDTYCYILSRMGYATYPQAFFVFYQVDKSGGGFQNVLPFVEEIRPVSVDITWVGASFEKAVKTARQPKAPAASSDCKHCLYVKEASVHFEHHDTQSDKDYVIIVEE